MREHENSYKERHVKKKQRYKKNFIYIQNIFTSKPQIIHLYGKKRFTHTKVTVKLKLVIKHKLYEAVQNMHEHPHALTKMKTRHNSSLAHKNTLVLITNDTPSTRRI